MLEDMILLLIALMTLSNGRLQQSEGRCPKLVAGALVASLGAVPVFWPARWAR